MIQCLQLPGELCPCVDRDLGLLKVILRGKKQTLFKLLMYILSKTVIAYLLSSVTFTILKLYFQIIW